MLKVTVLRFLLFWGVWLLVPMFVDGVTGLGYLWVAYQAKDKKIYRDMELIHKSLVTIVVPVYNAERTLYQCLASIAAQDYPSSLMEVLCVGNGVTDRSPSEFARARMDFPKLHASWFDIAEKGKSKALNAGLHRGSGELIINVDADTRLAPDAVSLMVTAFQFDDTIGAASGSIQVDEMDENEPWWWRLFNQCEIIEYLQAFHVGRRYQTKHDSVFTLSGAFAAFRRNVVLSTYLYDDVTVSEDTKLTFDIRTAGEKGWKIVCVDEAQAFVEPLRSLGRLMSQRLRWQRGQIEVFSLFTEFHHKTPFQALGSFIGRILIADHTLAFPRLVWLFIMPFLYLLGYSLPLVAMALWLTYLMYILLETLFLVAIRVVLKETYGRRAAAWWYLPIVMPIYRFITYWFRLAGMIYVLTEPAQWSTMNETQRLRSSARSFFGVLKSFLPKKRTDVHDGGVTG